MYSRKAGEDQAREHLEAFWNGSSLGRPALHLLALDPQHRPDPFPVGGVDRTALDFDPAFYRHTARDILKGGIFLAEAFPFVSVDPGNSLVLTAMAAGGRYRRNGSDAWLEKQPGILDQQPPKAASASVLRVYAACVEAAAKGAGGMGFVTPSCLIDPITTLSQMAGSEEMSIALCDRPAKVKAWIDALTDIWLELLRTCVAASGAKDSAVFWGPTTPGTATCLQCDYAVMISPDMFDEFVLPALMRMAEPMTRTLYHLDGTVQMRFLDRLMQIPKCKGIQWNPETDFGLPTRHLAALEEIRSRGLSLFLIVDTLEEAVETVRALGPDGLFIKFRGIFQTRKEAEAVLRELELASR
ncbi:hypothetical protein GX586_15440 [bacterium]|nr:hypothetical protein [bacterium]